MALNLTPMSQGKSSLPLSPMKTPDVYQEASIHIGDVSFPIQEFRWEFIPGPTPYKGHARFTVEQHRKIQKLKNPVRMRLRCKGEIAGQKQDVDMLFQNLYLIEGKQTDRFHYDWEIQDVRFLWRGEKITIKANRTWKVNRFGEGARGVVPGNPGALREPFDRFALYRYVPWSVQPTSHKPYTAQMLLKEAFKQLPGPKPTQYSSDNGYIAENIVFEEEEAAHVLHTLCSWARCNIGIDLNGIPYVYSLDELDMGTDVGRRVPLSRQVVEGGIIYKEDRSRIRPSSIAVKFRKKQEIIIRYQDQTSKYQAEDNTAWRLTPTANIPQRLIDEGRAIACQNVIALPNDIQYQNKWYQRGSYMLITDFLAALNLSEAQVRNLWFGDLLMIKHAILQQPKENIGPGGEPDPQAVMRVRAIQHSYRRLWQADPYWVQRWESWEAVRCTVVDPVSGFSVPSPVWQDFCLVPKIRPPTIATKAKYLYATGAYNWIISQKDPNRTQPVTAATIRIVDKELGIFEVTFPQLINDVIADILPCAMDELPKVSPVASLYLWHNVKLRESFEMETIISAIPAVDPKGKPTEDQFCEVIVINTNKNSKGPDIETMTNQEVARYPVEMGLSSHNLGLGKTSLDEAKQAIAINAPVNLGYVVPVAKAEATRIFHSYKDRHAGFATCAGVDTGKLKLFGQCRGIVVIFSETNGGLKTYYDVTQPPEAPNLYNLLPEYAKRYIYRQLPQIQ